MADDRGTLTTAIASLHDSLRGAAASSINRFLTIRNWLIGRYIVEYEQHGEDRATYGERLIRSLAGRLSGRGIRGMSFTNLNLFRKFYRTYPQLGTICHDTASAIGNCGTVQRIIQKASEQFGSVGNGVASGGVSDVGAISAEQLLRHFSFSHFVELMRLDDPLKRAFYEIEGIKGCWSVPQLKRQIETLLYERTGLSRKKRKLIEAVHAENKTAGIDHIIRDPYILEFTGLPERAWYNENDLETALLDHIVVFA